MQFEEVPNSEPAEVQPPNLATNEEHMEEEDHGHLPAELEADNLPHDHDNEEQSEASNAGPPKPKL